MPAPAGAFDLRISPSSNASSQVTARAAFTPGDNIAGQISDAVRNARRQVLVQAYSFTHDGIAKALIDAQRRGIEVKIIADQGDAEKMERGQILRLASAGIPVWLDGEHQIAHNKIVIIDAGTPSATVITGSFNFTKAAQNKNAENMVFLSGSEKLADDYVRNWQAHLVHSQPLRLH
jgi:phosphatidylserine/phosphatidylglycerophosphate/cardiolipin synthase-like enzyme